MYFLGETIMMYLDRYVLGSVKSWNFIDSTTLEVILRYGNSIWSSETWNAWCPLIGYDALTKVCFFVAVCDHHRATHVTSSQNQPVLSGAESTNTSKAFVHICCLVNCIGKIETVLTMKKYLFAKGWIYC